MSKIKTTSKVSLNLPSRINHGRQGTHAPTSQLWTQPISSPTALKGLKPPQRQACVPRLALRTREPPAPIAKSQYTNDRYQMKLLAINSIIIAMPATSPFMQKSFVLCNYQIP